MIRRYAGAVVAVVQHVREEMGRAKAMDAAVRLLERRWADVVRPLHDFYRRSSQVEDPLDDLEVRYAALGEQLEKERSEFETRRGELEDAYSAMTSAFENERARLGAKIDRLTRPWRAVKCNGPGPEQYNVARERPHDPARGFYSPGVPVLSYDHFLGGGFKKEEAERHAKQLNADLADDSLE